MTADSILFVNDGVITQEKIHNIFPYRLLWQEERVVADTSNTVFGDCIAVWKTCAEYRNETFPAVGYLFDSETHLLKYVLINLAMGDHDVILIQSPLDVKPDIQGSMPEAHIEWGIMHTNAGPDNFRVSIEGVSFSEPIVFHE